jgi:hypothetical protein
MQVSPVRYAVHSIAACCKKRQQNMQHGPVFREKCNVHKTLHATCNMPDATGAEHANDMQRQIEELTAVCDQASQE